MNQNKERGVFVTVNTDAGYSYHWRRGSYAYWIVYNGRRITGGGVMKEQYTGPQNKGPYDSEMKAILNALAAIKKTDHPPILGFIFNRDNINARSGKNGDNYQRLLSKEIRWFRSNAINRLGARTFTLLTSKNKQYADFRHVKAHSGTDTARKWVNDWLDRQCKIRFQEWYDANIKPNEI
jgi:hypothetical protein